MAIIPGGQKIRTIDASVDMTERGSALINSKSEVYTMDDFVETIGGGALPILTEYPTTDASKAGQQFLYKGRLWVYHTQAMLDDLGWTTVSEGFPAPVDKITDLKILYPEASIRYSAITSASNVDTLTQSFSSKLDFLGIYSKSQIIEAKPPGISGTVTEILNANVLVNLEDIGTLNSLYIQSLNMSDTTIDALFTQLPPTTKTATINVVGNPGAATCDPTIATAKGYTVITS